MAGQDLNYSATTNEGFCGSLKATGINNPYGGFDVVLRPELGLRKGSFSFSLGYMIAPFSTGLVTGIPITADVSLHLQPFERLSFRPRASFIGPGHFYSGSAYESYRFYVGTGGGVDAIYDPFLNWKIKPVIAIGGSAGYAFGIRYDDITDHTEPLQGFGAAANASLSILYSRDPWSAALQTGASYGGRLVPQVSLSFLW